MFARVAMYEQIDVKNWEPVATWFQEHGEELNRQLAGYQGSMTLLDRENDRLIGIGLYDAEADARDADTVMDQGPPSGMPEDLQEILMRGSRSHNGVYEVLLRDGQMNPSRASDHPVEQ